MKRIGLYGGSFDPVHRAHVALARLALDHLMLDELRWIPAGDPWQKDRDLTPALHRVAMLALAGEGDPRLVIDEREVKRQGPSYSIDTVEEFLAEHPQAELYFVIGQDQYENFHTWRRWTDLLQKVTLAVAGREGEAPAPSPEVAAVPHRAVALPLPRIDVSSHQIRERIAQGRDYTDMVPAPVARYIEQNHLYRGTPRS